LNAPDPLFLATATEIVLKAGDIQRARRESGFRVDKKGSIDLVTEVDLECERMCRAILADRFPEHDVLGEELSTEGAANLRSAYRWVYDPLDGTTNYAHGLPIYCSSLALEIDGGAAVAAIYDPSRQELFTAELGQGAFLNGTRLRVSATGSTRSSSRASRTTCTCSPRNSWDFSVRSSPRRGPCAAWVRPRWICATWRRAASTASGSSI
jgi:myo-inositol-1(or 4)-monophosphatase